MKVDQPKEGITLRGLKVEIPNRVCGGSGYVSPSELNMAAATHSGYGYGLEGFS